MTFRDRLESFKAWPDLVAFAAGALLVIMITSMRGSLLGLDGYYHIRMAELYANGAISNAGEHFHWTLYSLWNGHFSDKDFLWHILMVPLVWVFGSGPNGLESAAMVSAAAASGLVLATLSGILRKRDAQWPLLWALLLLAISTTFVYRLALPRSYLLSITFALLGWHWIDKRRWIKLSLLAIVYTLSYTAPHVLYALAFVWMLVEGTRARIFEGGSWLKLLRHLLSPLLAITLGITIGVLIHPHSSNLVSLWLVQNLVVPAQAMGLDGFANTLGEFAGYTLPAESPGPIKLGGEMTPMDTATFLRAEWGALVLLILPWVYASLRQVRPRAIDVSAWLCSLMFLAMMLNAQRFAEYFYPFATLSAALLVGHANRVGEPVNQRFAPLLQRMPFFAAALIGVAGLARPVLLLNLLESRNLVPREAYLAVDQHVPNGEGVFHADWGDFTKLFFYAPDKNYVNGLDPTFFFLQDHRRFALYDQVKEGKAPKGLSVDQVIRDDFGMRYVLVRSMHMPLKLQLQRASFARFAKVSLLASDDLAGWWLYDLGPNDAQE